MDIPLLSIPSHTQLTSVRNSAAGFVSTGWAHDHIFVLNIVLGVLNGRGFFCKKTRHLTIRLLLFTHPPRAVIPLIIGHSIKVNSYYGRSVGHSLFKSSPFCVSRPIFGYFEEVWGLLMWASSLTIERVYRLQLLLTLARAVNLRFSTMGTAGHISLSQIRHSCNVEDQLPLFTSFKKKLTQLQPPALVLVPSAVTRWNTTTVQELTFTLVLVTSQYGPSR
jgi:hypothetical protein